jgi:hypothetical protein
MIKRPVDQKIELMSVGLEYTPICITCCIKEAGRSRRKKYGSPLLLFGCD